jgi:hypothetical protein
MQDYTTPFQALNLVPETKITKFSLGKREAIFRKFGLINELKS